MPFTSARRIHTVHYFDPDGAYDQSEAIDETTCVTWKMLDQRRDFNESLPFPPNTENWMSSVVPIGISLRELVSSAGHHVANSNSGAFSKLSVSCQNLVRTATEEVLINSNPVHLEDVFVAASAALTMKGDAFLSHDIRKRWWFVRNLMKIRVLAYNTYEESAFHSIERFLSFSNGDRTDWSAFDYWEPVLDLVTSDYTLLTRIRQLRSPMEISHVKHPNFQMTLHNLLRRRDEGEGRRDRLSRDEKFGTISILSGRSAHEQQ